MKRVLLLLLSIVIFVTVFAGCSENKNRKLFNTNLKKYVTLGEYTGFKIDVNSEEIQKYINEINESTLNQAKKHVTEGTVKDGDVVNIDYAGSVNGVAFTGGTSEGYDLTIGSGNFIEGFEEQLIGKEIGSTVDINVTFPEGYSDTTDLETGSKVIKLSGTPAVFKVKINYAQVTADAIDEEIVKLYGFNSVEEYNEETKISAVKNYISDTIISNATINSYPQEDIDNYYGVIKEYYTRIAQQNGTTYENFLSSQNVTEQTIKSNVKDTFIKQDIVFYAILDKEKLSITEEDVANYITKTSEKNGADETEYKNYYERLGGDYYFEAAAVTDKVMSFIIEKSEITY